MVKEQMDQRNIGINYNPPESCKKACLNAGRPGGIFHHANPHPLNLATPSFTVTPSPSEMDSDGTE